MAEMAKLIENNLRDVNIGFANELSLMCDSFKINIWELFKLANRHPRVNILLPSPDVGVRFIAVDPWFIVSSAPDEARLIRPARATNNSKPEWVLERVHAAIGSLFAANPQKTAAEVALAAYGLACQPDIDDLRESPALAVVLKLCSAHPGSLMAVEPFINSLPSSLSQASLVTCAQVTQTDINVLLIDHTAFKNAAVPTGRKIDCRGEW